MTEERWWTTAEVGAAYQRFAAARTCGRGRPLLEASSPDTTFVAVFVGDVSALSLGEAEDALRSLLSA